MRAKNKERTVVCLLCEQAIKTTANHQKYCLSCFTKSKKEREKTRWSLLKNTKTIDTNRDYFCQDCEQYLGFDAFYKNYRCKSGLRGSCKSCFDKKHENSRNARRIEKLFGLIPEQHKAMLSNQNERCLICGEKPAKERLSVDHDHKTGEIRGLLCRACNGGLGIFKDNVLNLKRAISYLNGKREYAVSEDFVAHPFE